MHDTTLKYPRPAIGYIFAASSIIFGVAALIVGKTHKLITPTLITLSMVYGLVALSYYLVSIYKIHKILWQATDGAYPILPWRAVLLGLIPFYSIYWSFKWTGEIALFMNHMKNEDRFPQNRYGWTLFGGTFLGLLGSALAQLGPGLTQIVCFWVIGDIVKNLRNTLVAHTLPIQGYETEKYKSNVGIILASVVAIFVLSYLAIMTIPHLGQNLGLKD